MLNNFGPHEQSQWDDIPELREKGEVSIGGVKITSAHVIQRALCDYGDTMIDSLTALFEGKGAESLNALLDGCAARLIAEAIRETTPDDDEAGYGLH